MEPDHATVYSLSSTSQRRITSQMSPRSNLPLPCELRDMVLREILHGNHVPIHGNRFTLQVNLLRASREMYTEAAAILYEENTFILVTSQGPRFYEQLIEANVPVLAVRCKFSFQHHSLRLHMTHADIVDLAAAFPIKSAVILKQDLPALCNMVMWSLPYFECYGTYVYSTTGHSITNASLSAFPSTIATPRIQPIIGIMVRSTPNNVFRNDQELWNFVGPLARITSVQQKITIQGLTLFQAKALRQRMTPTLIWTQALIWRIFEMARSRKEVADHFARDGDIDRAIDCHSEIMAAYDQIREIRKIGPLDANDDDMKLPYDGVMSIIALSMASLTLLYVRNGDMYQARFFHDIFGNTLRESVKEKVISRKAEMDTRNNLCLVFMLRAPTLYDGSVHERAKHAISVMEANLAIYPCHWVMQDRDAINSWCNAALVDPATRLDARQTSAYSPKVRIFDLPIDISSAVRPAHLVGSRDEMHLKGLTEAEEALICDFQRINNVEVTDFGREKASC